MLGFGHGHRHTISRIISYFPLEGANFKFYFFFDAANARAVVCDAQPLQALNLHTQYTDTQTRTGRMHRNTRQQNSYENEGNTRPNRVMTA